VEKGEAASESELTLACGRMDKQTVDTLQTPDEFREEEDAQTACTWAISAEEPVFFLQEWRVVMRGRGDRRVQVYTQAPTPEQLGLMY